MACNHQYQEGSSLYTQPCYCGTDSIGSCHECSRRVCGIHSDLFQERRLCLDDLINIRERIRTQAVAAEEERRVVEVKTLVDARVEWLRGITDANARALYSALLCTRLFPGGRILKNDLLWIRKEFCSPVDWREIDLLRPSPDFSKWQIDWGKIMSWGRPRTRYSPVDIKCYSETLRVSHFSKATVIKKHNVGSVRAWLVSDTLVPPTWISDEASKLSVRNGKSSNGRGTPLDEQDLALVLKWADERPGILAANPWGTTR